MKWVQPSNFFQEGAFSSVAIKRTPRLQFAHILRRILSKENILAGRTVKNVNLRFAAVGCDIINGPSCEWVSSPMSAVEHVWQHRLTCEEASGRCTACRASIVMYVCRGIKCITTHALYCHGVLVTLNVNHQRYQTTSTRGRVVPDPEVEELVKR